MNGQSIHSLEFGIIRKHPKSRAGLLLQLVLELLRQWLRQYTLHDFVHSREKLANRSRISGDGVCEYVKILFRIGSLPPPPKKKPNHSNRGYLIFCWYLTKRRNFQLCLRFVTN